MTSRRAFLAAAALAVAALASHATGAPCSDNQFTSLYPRVLELMNECKKATGVEKLEAPLTKEETTKICAACPGLVVWTESRGLPHCDIKDSRDDLVSIQSVYEGVFVCSGVINTSGIQVTPSPNVPSTTASSTLTPTADSGMSTGALCSDAQFSNVYPMVLALANECEKVTDVTLQASLTSAQISKICTVCPALVIKVNTGGFLSCNVKDSKGNLVSFQSLYDRLLVCSGSGASDVHSSGPSDSVTTPPPTSNATTSTSSPAASTTKPSSSSSGTDTSTAQNLISGQEDSKTTLPALAYMLTALSAAVVFEL